MHPILLMCCHPAKDIIHTEFRSAKYLSRYGTANSYDIISICLATDSTHNTYELGGPLPSLLTELHFAKSPPPNS